MRTIEGSACLSLSWWWSSPGRSWVLSGFHVLYFGDGWFAPTGLAPFRELNWTREHTACSCVWLNWPQGRLIWSEVQNNNRYMQDKFCVLSQATNKQDTRVLKQTFAIFTCLAILVCSFGALTHVALLGWFCSTYPEVQRVGFNRKYLCAKDTRICTKLTVVCKTPQKIRLCF